MSCHGSFDAHDNHNLDTYHGHDSWPECKVAFVVCGDKHIGCNFLPRLITPVSKNCHHSSLDWVFGNEFGQGWCDRQTMLVVVENTWSGNTIPLPWKENIWNEPNVNTWQLSHLHIFQEVPGTEFQFLLQLRAVSSTLLYYISQVIWVSKYSTGWWPHIRWGRLEMKLPRPNYTKLDPFFCEKGGVYIFQSKAFFWG